MAIEIIEIDLKQVGAPKQACVTLAQTQVLEPSKIRPDSYQDSVEKAEKNQLIKMQSELIRKQLKRALLDEPNFVLFPELSIPWEMQDELREVAIKENVYIVGGLTYGPDYQNTCAVFPPFEIDKLPLQHKLNRAPAENENVKTGNRIVLFKNSGFGTFASVICYDFTSLHIGREMRDHTVNILFLPTHNRAVDLFNDMATGQCYTLYTYICLCNSAGAGFGNSASYGPVRKIDGSPLQQERVIGKLAGTQETTLPTKLDIPGLIDSIQRFKDNRAVLTGFITPPADLREPGVLISPFTPLGPARENFVGRENRIRKFWANIESNNHVLLLGPSGTGKTSLIHRIRAETRMEFQTGFIEVYDTEGTFDFFRRLSVEIISRAETAKRSVQFKDTLQTALDDIQKTRDAVARHGFEESSKAFIEAFHNLAQAIDAQTVGKIVLFIDQAERLAWLEEDPEKQRYAIRILINIMRDLEVLRAPVLFALAIRQHDYDPLIALASNHIPAQIVPLEKFSNDDAILAVEKPLPPEITIDRAVSSQIAELSGGIPFFVQLLADATFKKSEERKVITGEVFDELNLRDQRDVFPILMNALIPNEQSFVEAMAMCREYTVKMEDITGELNIEPEEFRHVADLLLGKNIIESLENDRFRFVHDQMKGFIQREWLAAKMSNREKLRAETETALQMLFLSPEDQITVSFNILPLAMCCFKSLLLYDVDNLSRVLEQVATLKHRSTADLCAVVSAATFRCASRNVFNNLRSKIVPLLEKNEFYPQASMMLAIEIINEEKSDWNTAQRAIDLAEKLATEKKDLREEDPDIGAMGYYMLAASWAMAIDDFPRKDVLFGKFTKKLYEILQRKKESKKDLEWPYIKKGRVTSIRVFYGTFRSLSKAASWARQMGHFQEQNELLKRALEFAIEEANKEEKGSEYFEASDTLAVAADFAKKMGDEKLSSELYAKAIDLKLKYPEEKEEGYYSGPSFGYAEAADWADKMGDKKLRRELYETAIDLRLRHVEEKEKEENYSEALEGYAGAADWADKMRDEKLRKELHEKAIDLLPRYAEEKEKEGNYFKASKSYAEAVDWADKMGDEKLRKELYEKAIEVRLRSATANEVKNSLSSAAADYVQTAEWADAVGDYAKRDALYEKAAQSLREAADAYEKLASFLLNSNTLIAASALRDYFSEDAEKFAYFDKISSIVENCRWFFEDFSGMSRWG
jgi:predicted amidohydrolase/DNA polymerase III delta prime subunit